MVERSAEQEDQDWPLDLVTGFFALGDGVTAISIAGALCSFSFSNE